MNLKNLFTKILTDARDNLASDEFLNEFRIPNHFVRNRKLSMRKMVYYLIYNSKKIIDTAMDDFIKAFPEVQFPDVTKQAVSKGRTGIDHGLFMTLFSNAVAIYYEFLDARKRWLGRYHIFAIDGSDIETPSSESCFAEFGKKHDEKNPDRFWSQALLSVLYDVLEDIVVDAAIDKQDAFEGDLAMGHLARLADLGLQDDSIVIFDRGYYNAGLYQECIRTGCKCLMRLKSNSRLCKLEGNDVRWQVKAYDGTLMDIRVLKTPLPTGEIEYLVTNIFDEDITCDMFRELYFERWKIETKYEEAKERWEIEEFTGKTSLAVKQDIYITLFFTNLAAIVKADADVQIQKDTRSTNKFKYQAKRTYIIGRIKSLVPEFLIRSIVPEDVDSLFKKASKKRSQILPGRSIERKWRNRKRKHYENRKSAV